VGTSYYVTVTANASTGYLAAASSASAAHADTSALNAPTITNVTNGSSGSNYRLTVTFTAPSGHAPSSYSAEACTDSAMTLQCSAVITSFTSGSMITGLTHGRSYYVEILAVPPTGYIGSSYVTGSSYGV
jgi:hypothetical protein